MSPLLFSLFSWLISSPNSSNRTRTKVFAYGFRIIALANDEFPKRHVRPFVLSKTNANIFHPSSLLFLPGHSIPSDAENLNAIEKEPGRTTRTSPRWRSHLKDLLRSSSRASVIISKGGIPPESNKGIHNSWQKKFFYGDRGTIFENVRQTFFK